MNTSENHSTGASVVPEDVLIVLPVRDLVLFPGVVLPIAIQDWSLTSLQQRLFKTGGRLIRHARYFTLQLAESYLTGALFRQILQRIERLGCHPT